MCLLITGNPFRSSDLGVMSPARFLCAMPVFGCIFWVEDLLFGEDATYLPNISKDKKSLNYASNTSGDGGGGGGGFVLAASGGGGGVFGRVGQHRDIQ